MKLAEVILLINPQDMTRAERIEVRRWLQRVGYAIEFKGGLAQEHRSYVSLRSSPRLKRAGLGHA